MIGLVLGIALGFGVAFLREALDTRVRSTRVIADRLHMPLLGRLPRLPQAFRRSPSLVTVTDPHGRHAEAVRMLRSNIELVNLEHGAETIMLTSAVGQEGKSTTAANLAVAFAQAGNRVILVDFDLRHSSIHHFFSLDRTPGLTELATGEITVDEALKRVDVVSSQDVEAEVRRQFSAFSVHGADSPNGLTGTLRVIASGAPIVDSAWIVRNAFASIVEQVRQQSDLVIVDGPPVLLTGDAVEASTRIDALLMVTRLNHVRRPMLDEVERILRQSPSIKLGFVATNAETESGHGYLASHYHRQKTSA